MPSLPFRASLENQGVKSCTNDQFTETGIHSKPRGHVLDTFFFSRVLENLPWERRLKEGDLRSVESKQRVHRTFFFKKLICQKLLYLNHNVTAPGTPARSSLVFCVVQSKTVNSHRADYNMLDTFYPVGRKHTAWHRWGSHSHLICCGLWQWGRGGAYTMREYGWCFSQPLLQLSFTQAPSSQRLLLVQIFLFQGSLHIRWFYERRRWSIYLHISHL